MLVSDRISNDTLGLMEHDELISEQALIEEEHESEDEAIAPNKATIKKRKKMMRKSITGMKTSQAASQIPLSAIGPILRTLFGRYHGLVLSCAMLVCGTMTMLRASWYETA